MEEDLGNDRSPTTTGPDDLGRIVRETKDNWTEAPYYSAAEKDIDVQWETLIYPPIESCDFRRVLELAPGHGRCTAKLLELAEEIHLVDVNETCISFCQERFREHPRRSRIHYHVNDGCSLSMIEAGSITLVFSWDSMVHFEPELVRSYLLEFERVLAPGGRAAIHLSNYGSFDERPQGTNWTENPEWRSGMSQAQLHEFSQEAGLTVAGERLLEWGGIPALDCAAILLKPESH